MTVCVKKTSVLNFLLTVFAVSVSKTFRINKVASRLPIAVKNEKSKQKRLLHFLETFFRIEETKQAWMRFVLRRTWHAKTDKHPFILIDEEDASHPHCTFRPRYSEISKRLGVTRTTVSNWTQRLKFWIEEVVNICINKFSVWV